MLDDFDKQLSVMAESVARAINRRRFIAGTAKGVFAALAGGALAQLVNVREAFASCPYCHWIQGKSCVSQPYGGSCPYFGGCPSGCTVCTQTDYCSDWCIYPNGQWVNCSGLGQCGEGYKVCTDCKCPDCSQLCTCLSGTICSGCCTPADVAAEAQRLHVTYPGASSTGH